jgi:LysM domain-containing protein
MRSIEHPFDYFPRSGAQKEDIVMATVRLTRRGRIVLVLFVMTLLVLAGFTLGHGSSQAADSHPRQTSHTLIVQPGESLWSVASRIAPHSDPRAVVADIESLNHLSGPAVEPGQQLAVPTIG